jgi:hypothetical protein
MLPFRKPEIVTNQSMIFLDMPCCHCVCSVVYVHKARKSHNGKGYTDSDAYT